MREREIHHLRDTNVLRIEISGAVQHCEQESFFFFVGYKLFIFFSSLFVLAETTRVERKLIFAPQRRVDSAFTGVGREHPKYHRRYNVASKRRDIYGSHRELHRCNAIMAIAYVPRRTNGRK